jgi:serine/threonine-protein kinase HipA
VKRTIRVHIGDEAKLVGTLHYDQQGARESAMFEYDPTRPADPAHFAIELGLPLIAGPQFHRKTRDGSVFHVVIADTGLAWPSLT